MKALEIWMQVGLLVAACIPAGMIATLLFLKAERLNCGQRIGLGMIGAALLLSNPAFQVAFRLVLFGGLGVYLWACYGDAIRRKLDPDGPDDRDVPKYLRSHR